MGLAHVLELWYYLRLGACQPAAEDANGQGREPGRFANWQVSRLTAYTAGLGLEPPKGDLS